MITKQALQTDMYFTHTFPFLSPTLLSLTSPLSIFFFSLFCPLLFCPCPLGHSKHLPCLSFPFVSLDVLSCFKLNYWGVSVRLLSGTLSVFKESMYTILNMSLDCFCLFIKPETERRQKERRMWSYFQWDLVCHMSIRCVEGRKAACVWGTSLHSVASFS